VLLNSRQKILCRAFVSFAGFYETKPRSTFVFNGSGNRRTPNATVCRAHDAVLFHQVDQARGWPVANSQAPLELGGGIFPNSGGYRAD